MSSIDLDELTELSAYVREARRRWHFSEQDMLVPAAGADVAIEAGLRRLRQIRSAFILLQDVNGASDLETTGRDLSRLAEDCLEQALTAAEARVAERFGALTDTAGAPIRLIVIGMGKLGGEELNFNSDIDLVFAFAGDGESQGPRRAPAREYLTRVARALVALIDEVTEHGRVWATDTRLRPFGEAGALVWSAGAVKQYYLAEGRTWERYALIKARPVAGDIAGGERLLQDLQPFVYRRYLDFGIFDELRGIQREIRHNAQRSGQADNIKRGTGGIRELEFIVQSLQLLRGGRYPSLRACGFLPALDACRKHTLLPAEEAEQLAQDYRFLRTLENRLQACTGRQTHELPVNTERRAQLARLMGAVDWASLQRTIETCRARVHERFRERFQAQPSGTSPAFTWPPGGDGALARKLAQAGLPGAEQAAGQLKEAAARLANKPLSGEGRRRLNALMPELIDCAVAHTLPEAALADLLRLIETIARRSAYLALLKEQPAVLQRLVRVFSDSHRVAEWIILNPQLLDDLLDPVHGYDLIDAPDSGSGSDLEDFLAAQARFRQAGFLHTALGELDGKLDVTAARAQLSRLAKRIVKNVFARVADDPHGCAIIAYGNFGAGEMHYQSDLDLVFLYPSDRPSPLRGVQRLINLLQAPAPGGRLYEIDTRLRPNGRAGMLVSTIDNFSAYQRRQAWTWEHQALIRATWVAGDPALAPVFDDIRSEVLTTARDPNQTVRALVEMRRRQRRERRESPLRRVLTDIQFVTELGVLLHAANAPELLRVRATAPVLKVLADLGWLTTGEAAQFEALWHAAGQRRHHRFLNRDDSRQPTPPDNNLVQQCEQLWQQVLARVG